MDLWTVDLWNVTSGLWTGLEFVECGHKSERASRGNSYGFRKMVVRCTRRQQHGRGRSPAVFGWVSNQPAHRQPVVPTYRHRPLVLVSGTSRAPLKWVLVSNEAKGAGGGVYPIAGA